MITTLIVSLAALSTPLLNGPAKTEAAVFGAGCFWCYEPIFAGLKGVSDVEVGYAGGARPNPTYEQVGTGRTGHAEVYKVTYDPKAISRADLLRVFFTVHDPTQLNRQGPDVGTHYRSVIFFASEGEKQADAKILNEVRNAKLFPRPVVTTLEPLVNYTRAEEYHQDYWEKYERATPAQRSRMNASYCNAYVTPKVLQYRKKLAHLMKSN